MFSTCAKWSITASEHVCTEWAGLPPLSAEGVNVVLGAVLSTLAVVWVGRRVIRFLSGPSTD